MFGAVVLYTQSAVVDRDSFGDRAVEALHDEDVRTVVSREVAGQLVGSVGLDLGATPPEVQATVDRAIRTPAFERAFRRAAGETHRALFGAGEGSVYFDLPNASRALAESLEGIAPGLAAQIPPGVETRLLEVERENAGVRALALADDLAPLGAVLLVTGLGLLAAAWLTAADRRAAVTRIALSLAVAGGLLVLGLLLLRELMAAGAQGGYALAQDDVSPAVEGVWDAYAGDLLTWALVLTGLALLIALVSRRWSPMRLRSAYSAASSRSSARPRTRIR
ncbi:MAG: hypothetical protein JW895_12620 [Thermoleophilaceae bacterium]|nr:hypothetical protein [Thermoleophilaceae bacterium]